MNTEYCISIAFNGRCLVTVELPPRASEQQAEAIARKFASRFLERDGYRFVVKPLPNRQNMTQPQEPEIGGATLKAPSGNSRRLGRPRSVYR